jgi:NTP pyrophosphatase (non-canonical NTP hydrolase)
MSGPEPEAARMPDPLLELRDALRAFATERDWDQFHSPRNLDAGTRAAVEEELADVLLYLVRLADKLDVDLHAAARAKIVKNAGKYPVDKARGSSRKYDAL